MQYIEVLAALGVYSRLFFCVICAARHCLAEEVLHLEEGGRILRVNGDHRNIGYITSLV